jgi:hypothetical protein
MIKYIRGSLIYFSTTTKNAQSSLSPQLLGAQVCWRLGDRKFVVQVDCRTVPSGTRYRANGGILNS